MLDTSLERQLEVVWAAGIIEGEGYIGVKKGGGDRIRCVVNVGQVYNDAMIKRLQRLWGGHIWLNTARSGYTPILRWEVSANIAELVCRELLQCPQFQGPKRDAARALIVHRRDVSMRAGRQLELAL